METKIANSAIAAIGEAQELKIVLNEGKRTISKYLVRGEYLSIGEISKRYGISRGTLGWRISHGQLGDDLILEPKGEVDYPSFVGRKFDSLSIISLKYLYTNKSGNKVFDATCKCDCGNICHKRLSTLISNVNYHECPICISKHNSERATATQTKYPQGFNKEYKAWKGIRHRCYNPKSEQYSNYGGRGIVMCDRWRNDFVAFLEDMGKCPKGLSIDRIDVNGNYTPENCRWATMKQQCNNKRNTLYVTYEGQTKTLMEWCDMFGLKDVTLRANFHRNGNLDTFFSRLRTKRKDVDDYFLHYIVSSNFALTAGAQQYLG